MTDLPNKKIALFIDCDNISYQSINKIINELSNIGVTYIKNAYGDWESPNMKGWKSTLIEYAIKPIQQFAYTKKKNSTDMAMIIDIMDLLHNGQIDAFALATSDSDFTPIVMRVLREGLMVYGFGAKKTPDAFINACSVFIYTEETSNNGAKTKAKKTVHKTVQIKDNKLIQLISDSILEICDSDGWAYVSSLGNHISRKSSFSPKNYGHKTLGGLLGDLKGSFETKMDDKIMYVKVK